MMSCPRGRWGCCITVVLIVLALPVSGAFLTSSGSSIFQRTCRRPFAAQCKTVKCSANSLSDLGGIGWNPLLLLADITGSKPEIIGRESWAWSHGSRNGDSIILKLTARIEEEGGKDKASPDLIRARKRMMSLLLQHDYNAYVQAATTLGGLIDRKDLPNVQDIPYPSLPQSEPRKTPQRVDKSLLGGVETSDKASGELVPDCVLPPVTFSESPLDKGLLWVFRKLVQKETGYASQKEGILGLLEEGREYMLRPQQTAEAQHRMVYNTLAGLMTPVMPVIYKTFMTGIYNGKQIGPWPWAPWLTSFVTPTFFGFLVGPSRPNRRADGSLGGLVVEKCKFLQESGCKGLCMNQCKLPAQQFFDKYLGLPLSVTPNFETQECQWSFGEIPKPVEQDPRMLKGCLAACPTREALREANMAKSCY